MTQVCETGSCKLDDRIWGIVSKNKLHRLTFSKSLAEFICCNYGDYQMRRFNVKRGRKLAVGETSKSGVYLIVSSKGVILRASVLKGTAELYCDGETRFLYEGFLA